MRFLNRINKIIKLSDSSEIDLIAPIKLNLTEVLELNKSLKENPEAAYFKIEAEFSDISAELIEAEDVDYLYGPKNSVDSEYLSNYSKKFFDAGVAIGQLSSDLAALGNSTVTELIENKKKLNELSIQRAGIQEHDALVPIVQTMEEYLKQMQTSLNRANKLLASAPAGKKVEDNLEELKSALIEERENKLIQLTKTEKQERTLSLPNKTKNNEDVGKIFILMALFVLLFGIFALITTTNILLTLLSLVVAGAIGGLYLFAKAIPSLPVISKFHTVVLQDEVDLGPTSSNLELKVVELAKSRKDQILKEDIEQQLNNILAGQDLISIQEQIEFSMEEIRINKERIKTLEPLTQADLLEIMRNIDILTIDISRAQNDISLADTNSDISPKISELELLNDLQTEVNNFAQILSGIIGFNYIKKEGEMLLVSKDGENWSSLELTSRQIAQLSAIDSLEKRLRADYTAPIVILNPKKLFNQYQQDLISKRIYDLQGMDTQFFFVDVI